MEVNDTERGIEQLTRLIDRGPRSDSGRKGLVKLWPSVENNSVNHVVRATPVSVPLASSISTDQRLTADVALPTRSARR